MEGTYQVQYQSPFDSGKAILYLAEKDGVLQGKLSVHDKYFTLTYGEKEENRFSFTGKFGILGLDISYMMRGTINEDTLTARVHTALGMISATGTKVK